MSNDLLRALLGLQTQKSRPKRRSSPPSHRCHRCGGKTVKTGFVQVSTGKPIRVCKGCGRTFTSNS